MAANKPNNSNIIRVKLIKQKKYGLGFLVRERPKSAQVVVTDLVTGGMAAESGLVQIGDVVLKVNDKGLVDISYKESLEILKSLPVNGPVVLILQGPEGYTSHLETRFNDDGTPRTIRVTKPSLRSESLMDRIKKTLSGGQSTKPCRTKQTQANCECHTDVPTSKSVDDAKLDHSFSNGGVNSSGNIVNKSLSFNGSVDNKGNKHKSSSPETQNVITDQEGADPSNGKYVCNNHKGEKAGNNNKLKKQLAPKNTQVTGIGNKAHDLEQNTKYDINSSIPAAGRTARSLNTDDSTLNNNSEREVPSNTAPLDQHTFFTSATSDTGDEISVFIENAIKPDSDTYPVHTSSGRVLGGNERQEGLIADSVVKSDTSGSVNLKMMQQTAVSPGTVSGDMTNGDSGNKENGDINVKGKKGLEVNGTLLERRGSNRNSPVRKFVKLKNVGDERPVCTDTLHQKSQENVKCTQARCMGSIMDFGQMDGQVRPKEEVLSQAKDFIDQYYQSIKRSQTPAHLNRWTEVEKCIETTGTYELTYAELTYGAKTAWRNAPRCIGRIQWSKLQVFDARHITTARGMFEAICNHIKYGTNKGNIRSAITVFPPRTDGRHDFKIWNPQFIQYAGYKQEDGSIVGDPSNVTITEICQKLGWKGKGTRFDVIPLILQANGHDPEVFEIPPDLILEVNFKHPKLPWFADLGLKWYCLPAVSSMCFDCGGLLFCGAPFNGWYMGTEIGARDLCDKYRYNLLEDIAKRMGFDTRKSASLWKDRTLIEVNVAVLHSFQSQGVTITDHHAAAESFMKHLDNEQKLRGGCPADWVWICPPMSASILPVFHQEMLCYKMRPSFEYQVPAWKNHVWKKDRERTRSASDKPRRKIGFRELARAVKFSAKLMGRALARRVKCIILYATETGKSESFAKTLCQTFKHAFDAKVMCMDEYDVSELEHEALVLIVTSTFGNGDPPENGESFAKALYEIKHPDSKDKLTKQPSYLSFIGLQDSKDCDDQSDISTADTSSTMEDALALETGPLSNVRYSVFGLGSSAYPNFCAYGHYLDDIIHDMGGEKIYKMGEGDELCGQEESFRTWGQDIFKAACETFCVGDDNILKDAAGSLTKTDSSWTADRFRLTPANNQKEMDVISALSVVHGKTVLPSKCIERVQLQSPESDRQTLLVKFDSTDSSSELLYNPGDHVAIFPENSQKLVDAILMRLHNAPSPDQLIKVEVLSERSTPLGTVKSWDQYPKYPVCTLRTAFSRFLDITTPPSQTLLKLFATQAGKECDMESLENLANDSHMYEEWKHEAYPNMVQVLDQFPSLRIPPSLLLTQLPLLQSRYYSISSSLTHSPGEIHCTVAVVKYRTQGEHGPLHEGVCSTWLNKLEIGTTIPCLIRSAPSFRMPDDPTLPMILVGPGTGIAPFRSFWQQRKIDMEMQKVPQHGTRNGWGHIYLYFGCRNSELDDIYKNELQQMKNTGVLKEAFTALSREQNHPKTYVQNILKQNASDIFRCIVRESGHFYVCGDVKMASDVTATLEKVLETEGNMTQQDSKNFILKLRDGNRFHEDIFGVTLRSSEVTDRARDQAKKAWNFINSSGKSKMALDKETVAPIPSDETKAPKGKPRAPQKM